MPLTQLEDRHYLGELGRLLNERCVLLSALIHLYNHLIDLIDPLTLLAAGWRDLDNFFG